MKENKFNPFSAKELEFVTYGGLSLNKQNGYDPTIEKPTFHSPPARKGIYAFVWPYIEPFLLGGDDLVNPKSRGKNQRNRIKYVRDKKGNVVTDKHPDVTKYIDSSNKNWTMNNDTSSTSIRSDTGYKLYNNHNRKKFKYSGPIWHHLIGSVKPFEVLDRHGDWVKTDMLPFINALKKELHSISKIDMQWSPNKGQPWRKSIKSSTIDHLEVFIDEKI